MDRINPDSPSWPEDQPLPKKIDRRGYGPAHHRSLIGQAFMTLGDRAPSKLTTPQMVELKEKVTHYMTHGLPTGIDSWRLMYRVIAHELGFATHHMARHMRRAIEDPGSNKRIYWTLTDPDFDPTQLPKRMPKDEYLRRKREGTLPRYYRNSEIRTGRLRKLFKAHQRKLARLQSQAPPPVTPQLSLFD